MRIYSSSHLINMIYSLISLSQNSSLEGSNLLGENLLRNLVIVLVSYTRTTTYHFLISWINFLWLNKLFLLLISFHRIEETTTSRKSGDKVKRVTVNNLWWIRPLEEFGNWTSVNHDRWSWSAFHPSIHLYMGFACKSRGDSYILLLIKLDTVIYFIIYSLL